MKIRFGFLFTLLLAAMVAVPSRAAEPSGGLRPFKAEFNGQWIGSGVSFSPFRRGQSPNGESPTKAQILEDLRIVSRHWHLIRMYGSGPDAERTLEAIRENNLPVRMVLGAWINVEASDAARAANRTQVENLIRLANTYRDIVLAVNVGNESLVAWSGHRVTPELLIGYLRTVRGAVTQPVTTADDHQFWRSPESQAVAAEVDFIILHAYALWNGRLLDEAMTWTDQVYDQVCSLHPDRPVMLGESGWASRHDPNKNGPHDEGSKMKGEVSVAAQAEYLRQHYEWVERRRVVTTLFEAFDESWKGSGPASHPDEAEKHWGVFTEDRRPKPSFLALLRERAPAEAVFYAVRPLVIGHRGYPAVAPENTLPSFKQALAAGADLVELDYHHSADGQPVVMHDYFLDRTSDARTLWGGKQLPIDGYTVAELRTLDVGAWFDPAYAGLPMPTLEETLDTIQAGGMALIERKHGDAATLAALLVRRGWVNRLVVQAFDWKFLRQLHELLPQQILGALGPHWETDGHPTTEAERPLDSAKLDRLVAAGARIVVWGRDLTAEGVREAHARGLKVWTYTIDDPDKMEEMLVLGVDGFITNKTPLMWRALARRDRPADLEPTPAPMAETVPLIDRPKLPESVYVPSPRAGYDWFYEQHRNFLQRGRDAPVGLLFLGDSITEAWKKVPELWNERYTANQPANFGISGDRIQHVLWRIDHGELDRIDPKVIVLLIGTNNTADNSAPEIVAGVGRILERIRAKLPRTQVLLLAMFPRGPRTNWDGSIDNWEYRLSVVREANRGLAKFDDGEHVRFLDIGHVFVDAEGNIPASLMPDQLHLSPEAYQRWADAMQPLLTEMLQ